MPIKKFIIALILLLIPSVVFSATLIFETGFESAVAVDAPLSTKQYFSDCSGANTGCTDASTSYNVPYDIPGICQSSTCEEDGLPAQTPYFNFVTTGDDQVQVTAADYVNGSSGLRAYFDYPNSRVQFVIYGNTASSLSSGNNFSRTCVKFWVKFTTLPSVNGKWLMWNEWQYGSGYPGRLMWINEGGTIYLQWFGGDSTATSWANRSWGDRSSVVKATYENVWLEVIVFYEEGSSGRCIVKIKPSGGAEATIVNFSGNNNVPVIYNYQPIKAYGTESDQWIYWDDLKWYASTGYTDLPPWDSEESDPTVTVSATDNVATEEGTTTGTWTISCSPDCAGETINYSFSGTATLNTDYNCDDEDGTIAITGASDTITLTPVDDSDIDPGEVAILTINTGTGYNVGSPDSDSISITDNDYAPPVGVVGGIVVDPSGTGSVIYTPSGSGQMQR